LGKGTAFGDYGGERYDAGLEIDGWNTAARSDSDWEPAAVFEGITRSRAGILALADQIEGSIVVIGNSPSALFSVCDLIHSGSCPSLVIGTPVGFVKAAESKEELRTKSVPSISNEGTRGGTPVAVAAMNEIITIHAEYHA
jgi:precorrin-8X/cobalt-precorrin-8 methylmutase